MYLLLDIGGTNMRLAITKTPNAIDEMVMVPTPANFDEAVEKIKEVAQAMSKQNTITAVACGVPGPLNKEKSEILNCPNLPAWNKQPLQKKLEELFSAPVQIENDAALAGLGEATFGAGKGKNIVVYLTISTGIGGAKISNGAIDEASLGFEPGHQIIVPDGELCSCGALGHLEAYASGTAMFKRYGQKSKEVTDPAKWQETIDYLAIGLNNTIVHWSPDIVILGGAVSRDINIEQLTSALKKLKPIFPVLPEIKKIELGEKSGLFGALALARNYKQFQNQKSE